MNVFAMVAAVLFSSSAAWAGAPEAQLVSGQANDEARKALIEAAQRAQVPINVEQIVAASSDHVTFVGTSIAGFEQVPATQFPEGTDVGFVYVDFPAAGIPAGYYRVRTHAAAEDVTVGTYPGTTEFISPEGRVVARLPTSIDTHSLEVPKPLPYPQTVVDASIDEAEAWGITVTLTLRFQCPNGSTLTIRIRITIRG